MELVREIMERLLFSFNLKPIEEHIMKQVDIPSIEKSSLNKCQSTDSRTAAYNLLITICNNCP